MAALLLWLVVTGCLPQPASKHVTPQSTSTLVGVHFTAVSWKALKSFSEVSFQASVLPTDCTRRRVGFGSSLKVHKPYANPLLGAASSLITAFSFALATATPAGC